MTNPATDKDFLLRDKYKVKLENYYGPLDLLLHLVKINELDIQNISISILADQYIKYIDLMKDLDINLAGEFLVMASTLMLIKARSLLPVMEIEEDDEEDPGLELVKKLLEYKKYKDRAMMFRRLIEENELKYYRPQIKIPKQENEDEEDIELNAWELCSAFARLSKEVSLTTEVSILYDDIPVDVMIDRIKVMINRLNEIKFSQVIEDSTNHAAIVSTLLASLELARQNEVGLYQDKDFDDILIRKNNSEVGKDGNENN